MTTIEKKYLLDGVPSDGNELCTLARQYGYVGFNGVLLVSEAAKTLKKNGYEVEHNMKYWDMLEKVNDGMSNLEERR